MLSALSKITVEPTAHRTHQALENRYAEMPYRRCGQSGLLLPSISLGFWQHAHKRELVSLLCTHAFDHGLTHFDLANNYGPPAGIAETNVGLVLNHELKAYRDELIISTKAGYDMWPGPYGNFGSRKYLCASLDQSLKRLGINYVDIFYHHRPDPHTPLVETIGALADIVRQGKALYVGISNYSGEQIQEAANIAQTMQVPLIINQVKYSMLSRGPETSVLNQSALAGQGVIAFSPLEQGLLTPRYLNGIPNDSRAAKGINNLTKRITPELVHKLTLLQHLAQQRGQDLAQLAMAWILRRPELCSVLIGVSSVEQLRNNLHCLRADALSSEELERIELILAGSTSS